MSKRGDELDAGRRNGTAVEVWIDAARRGGNPADVRRAEILCASHPEARTTTRLMGDFDRARAPRDGDDRAIEGAIAIALRARRTALRDLADDDGRADDRRPDDRRPDDRRPDDRRPDDRRPDDRRRSGERWKPAAPRAVSAIATPGPQPAIRVIRRPAPAPRAMGSFAMAAAVLLGIAIGAGAVAGGGVLVASISRERAISDRTDADVGTIAPREGEPEVDPDPIAIEPSRFAAARELLAHPITSHRASRWLVTARDALDEEDPDLAERVLRMVLRRWPRRHEAATARLALAEIYAATDRPRAAVRTLERWARTHRRDGRAPEIEARIAELRAISRY